MKITASTGILKRNRKASWKFQQTFETPSKDLPRFVDQIMTTFGEIERAQIAFDLVVFEPKYDLADLYAKYGLAQDWDETASCIEAESRAEVCELLQAVLSEWIDFLCVPSPGPLAIYADHDEYITFMAHRKGDLNRTVSALTRNGFKAVDYVRDL